MRNADKAHLRLSFWTPMITENITNLIREVKTGEASQGQRSAVLRKFKTTTESLFDTNQHMRVFVVSAYTEGLALHLSPDHWETTEAS